MSDTHFNCSTAHLDNVIPNQIVNLALVYFIKAFKFAICSDKNSSFWTLQPVHLIDFNKEGLRRSLKKFISLSGLDFFFQFQSMEVWALSLTASELTIWYSTLKMFSFFGNYWFSNLFTKPLFNNIFFRWNYLENGIGGISKNWNHDITWKPKTAKIIEKSGFVN